MAHEPERNAATYLAGLMGARRRRAFERHMLECEDCWNEVQVARRGRSLAESARELAPQFLKERVRTVVAGVEHPARRRHLVLLATAMAMVMSLAGLGYWWQASTHQPAVIQAVLTDYRGQRVLVRAATPKLPQHIGDLVLRGARQGEIGGLRLVAYKYRDHAGHHLVVYRADGPFPTANGAVHLASEETWTATLGEAVLYCAPRPVSSLVIGDDARDVDRAAARLKLR